MRSDDYATTHIAVDRQDAMAGGLLVVAAALTGFGAGVAVGLAAARRGRRRSAAVDASSATSDRARRAVAEAEARSAELQRLREDFVATVSHELRTPLTVIKAAVELLELRWERFDEQQRRDFVRHIARHVAVLERLTQRVLEFQRLRSRDRLPVVRPVRLADAIWELLEARPTLGAHHLLLWRVSPDLAVVADPELLQRLVELLVENAVRYTPAGTRVEVVADVDGPVARVVVRDDGPGVPAEELRWIDQLGTRGGDVMTRPGGGLGLGLALAREIVDAHGSDLVVESEPGVGTTVRFALPVAPAPPTVPRRTDRPSLPGAERPGDRRAPSNNG